VLSAALPLSYLVAENKKLLLIWVRLWYYSTAVLTFAVQLAFGGLEKYYRYLKSW
jgi:hypothetical protein